MKKTLIPVLLIFFFDISQAQTTFERLYQFGNDHCNGYAVFQYDDNSYIVAGSMGTNSTLHKILVFKINEWGDTIWSKTFGDTIYNYYQAEAFSCLITNDSSILVCGWNYNDVFLLMLDQVGSTIWSKQIGKISDTEMGFSIKPTLEGGFIITGLTHSYNGRNDLYLVNTDHNGDTLWTRTCGETWLSEAGNDVVQTTDSGFLAVGYSHCDSTGFDKVLLIKTDKLGDLQWLKRLGDDNLQNSASSVDLTSDNNFIITGNTGDYSSNAVLLLKLDQNGDTIWNKEILPPNLGYAYGNSIKVLPENECVITGGGGKGLFLLHTDSIGTLTWCHHFQELWTTGNEVSLTNDNGYILAGYCWDPSYFVDRVYLIKTDENGLITSTISNVKQNYLVSYPNPATGKLTIECSTQSEIEILNIEGETLKRLTTHDTYTIVDLSDFSSGIYIVKARSQKAVEIRKVIKI